MAYVLCTGPCYQCRQLFDYNPMKVPSLTIKGEREPFCLACIEQANVIRKRNGLEPIVPHPDAYRECDESELY